MNKKLGIDIGSDTIKAAIIDANKESCIETFEPVKLEGQTLSRLRDLLKHIQSKISLNGDKIEIAFTGSGATRVSKVLDIKAIPEIEALVASTEHMGGDVEHIIEIGAETQKYLSFCKDAKTGAKMLEDVIPGVKCAGGTGSFLDYMHKRLRYDSLENFIDTGMKVEDPASISGRCAVFAESDIVHHYQKGTSRDRIVAGIHKAVARSYKNLIGKGNSPENKIAMVGGLSKNKCMLKHLTNELKLDADQIVVPENSQHMGAIGAAMLAEEPIKMDTILTRLEECLKIPFEYEFTPPLKLEKSVIIDQSEDENIRNISLQSASLGVDIGSVSTKAAVITKIEDKFKVLASYYRRTEGNPIEAVKDVLANIQSQLKEKNITIEKLLAATTGSGRYLTGYFIGANEIRDEITAQAAGVSTFIKEKELTLIEIGGQDSKFLKLRDGVINDFEMNWACAAGTGALIEKHAKNMGIPITEFGDYALKGDKPPIINSTCAVFAESALLYYQQNNLSVANLCAGACLSSAQNYLIKVVRNRQIGEKVAFQGAVAFNKGMLAAFETVLNRPIIVPPYPHLTGAIGCARIAYEDEEKSPAGSNFRGFDEILNSPYDLSCFTCKKCGNECSVNMFKVGGETFYQGDRCDMYSGAHKKKQGEHLPDLFTEREEMMMNSYTKEAPAGAKTVGYPRGLLFSEFYPLFNAFFRELGFNFKASEPTNKQIINIGIEKTIAEPCFPIKIAHGHAASLLQQGVDYVFMPAIMRMEKNSESYEVSNVCPYVQAAPDVIKSALNIDNSGTKMLSPILFFERGPRHLERKLIEMAKELGKKPIDVKKALRVALKTQEDFRKKLAARGKEILENLSDDQIAFVVIGRPYGIHDPAINMNVGKKIRDEGFLGIPFDMLPLSDPQYQVSDSWPNMYPAQGQKKMAAARFIKNRPNLHALVVTYFGCGPDAFIDQMFYKELNRQYLTMQIDEHTSDTGILTRIQAHLSSARFENETKNNEKVWAGTTPFKELKDKKVWIPYMNECSRMLAAAMRANGVEARAVPPSSDKSLTLARNRISGDVCTPMLYTTQDMLERVSQPDFDPEKECFFQGKSCGPCRYGMYFMLEKMLLEDMAQKPVDVVTIGHSDSDGGLGNTFLIMGWDALLTHDFLQKMLLHTRPYEINQGDSDRVFMKYILEVEKATEDPQNRPDTGFKMASVITGANLDYLIKILKKAREEFESIPVERTEKPLVGMVGEYFVRQHEPSNFYIIRTLEQLGCEVWLAPGTEFLLYSNYITGVHAEDQWRDEMKLASFKEAQLRKMLNELAKNHEHKLYDVVKSYVGGMDETPAEKIVEMGDKYVTLFFGGEAILSMGKSEDFARRGLDGIISVGPFNCMPSLIVSALSKKLREKHNKIPFLNIDFDGFEDNSREQRISAFVSQVKERKRIKDNATPVKI